MKNIRHLIALMAAVFVFGAANAESLNMSRLQRDKDPWQIMQTTLYNHYVDTIGFSVVTPIEAELLIEITPDLTKAFHVKEQVDLSHACTLGQVICAFMQVKYAGRSGPTYDYYKYRYSDRLIYDKYLERYPNSSYASEMRMKNECLKQYIAWSNSIDDNDYFSVLMTYESSHCPYGGFAYLASVNNEARELAVYYFQSALSQKENLNDYDDNRNDPFNLYDKPYIDSYRFDEEKYYDTLKLYKDWIELPTDENQNNTRTENSIML